jgi:hypothetical protein
MKDVKITKYWRTEPMDKGSDKYWSGCHTSEQDAIQYILNSGTVLSAGDTFEVLPYYEIDYD